MSPGDILDKRKRAPPNRFLKYMKLDELTPDHKQKPADNEMLSAHEIQKNLFYIWFKATVINGLKRRAYKVPPRIQWLSCGCSRDRNNEVDINGSWTIIRKGPKYSHKECGREVISE